MSNRLIESMKEAVEYAKGDKKKGYATKISPKSPVEIPDHIDVKHLRTCLHMSQTDFAACFGFNVNTLRNWEHGRRHPEKAVLAYLLVISKNPELVEKSLRQL